MTTNKIPYEILAVQVEKLFEKELPDNDDEIDAHCRYIDSFITSCGWDVNEYFERWMQQPEN
jgi:hypothetical protein